MYLQELCQHMSLQLFDRIIQGVIAPKSIWYENPIGMQRKTFHAVDFSVREFF